MLKRFLAAAFALAALMGPALAHPHVWVSVESRLDYAPDGTLTGIRHDWTFDEGFSSYALQGLENGPDGKPTEKTLKELAQVNIDSLKEFDYFTYPKRGKEALSLLPPKDYSLTYDGTSLTLHFTLPFAQPVAKKGTMTLDVYDPTYFVAFQLADTDPVKLAGAAGGCTLTLHRPDPAAVNTTNLTEGFFNALTTASNYGSQFANRVTVSCS
ncbi:DUF1007 family protein [Ancylobacter amanitiformis]|uniref:ABC-type uncharacterized transport system substrate-binding protein n=1 Tax=Ancylobacter amanitiformis TaxID=217069 RepID=A0ABU0LP01_9HYPH|nr:DUF1007 family protein [Ancylobacter amanitiformis]MDQ0510429.1 ABC-type uncharacterized transport system substrate-binding protein [Ancylobacter amanitiformis]